MRFDSEHVPVSFAPAQVYGASYGAAVPAGSLLVVGDRPCAVTARFRVPRGAH